MSKQVQLDKETISLDTIGQAYIAEHVAAQHLTKITKQFNAGRCEYTKLAQADAALKAARSERNRLVLTFAAGAHTNSVTYYYEGAA